jgi:hypothetical protein
MEWRRVGLFLGTAVATLLFLRMLRLGEARIGLLETVSLRPVLVEAPAWLATATIGAGLLLIAGYLTFWLMPDQRRVASRNPLNALTSEQRRDAKRKIRGRLPVAPADVAVLRAAAEGIYLMRWTVVPAIGFLLLVFGLAMSEDAPVVSTLVAIPVLVAVALVLREARAAKAFLRTTGSTE